MFGHQSDDTNTNNIGVAMPPEPKTDGVLGGTVPAPVVDRPADNQPIGTVPLPHRSEPADNSGPTSNLLDIKTQALQQLSPLVDHLDQTPEEKFSTTMMMIQASDNQALVSRAYEAAQQITDEKTRAQALLDIVNEINYFTQHTGKAGK